MFGFGVTIHGNILIGAHGKEGSKEEGCNRTNTNPPSLKPPNISVSTAAFGNYEAYKIKKSKTSLSFINTSKVIYLRFGCHTKIRLRILDSGMNLSHNEFLTKETIPTF